MKIFIILIYFLVLILQLFLPVLGRKEVLFGVRIPEAAQRSNSAKGIRKIYYILIICFSLPITLFLAYVSFKNTAFIALSILCFTFISYIIFFYCHNLAAKYKMTIKSSNKEVTTIDLAFSKTRASKALISPWWFLIPFAIIIVNLIISYAYYPSIPNTIVKHYNASGIADIFVKKSPKVIFNMPLVMLILTVIMFVSYKVIGWSKQQLSSNNPEESLKKNKRFRHMWSLFFLIMSIFLNLLMTFINFLTLGLIKINHTGIVLVPMIISIVIILLTILLSFYTGQGGSRIKVKEPSKTLPSSERNDDKFWKLGLFYFNKEDPSIFIEKRFGVGWTVNFGRPFTLIIILLIFILILCPLFFL